MTPFYIKKPIASLEGLFYIVTSWDHLLVMWIFARKKTFWRVRIFLTNLKETGWLVTLLSFYKDLLSKSYKHLYIACAIHNLGVRIKFNYCCLVLERFLAFQYSFSSFSGVGGLSREKLHFICMRQMALALEMHISCLVCDACSRSSWFHHSLVSRDAMSSFFTSGYLSKVQA